MPFAFAPPAASEEPADLPELTLSEQHRQVSQRIAEFMERFHYSGMRLDNAMSSAVLDRYLDQLDGQRMYFLADDVAQFEQYRYELDERVKNGDLEPMFEIFQQYRKRNLERIDYALELLENGLEFDSDESFVFDRSELAWPATPEDLDDVWRQRITNDALSLLLAGSEWEQAQDTLRARYQRMATRMERINSDNVFETVMNAFSRTMDPHTGYLSPRNTEEYRIQMSLSYEGIGATLGTDGDLIEIVEVFPGGPAARDGTLKPQDRITGVGQGAEGDIEDVVGWTVEDVVQLIRGPEGSTVRLRVLPAGAPPGGQTVTLELVRDQVRLEEQAARKEVFETEVDGETRRVGVIEIPSFYQDHNARASGVENYTSTTRDVARLLGELKAEGVDGVLIDLRGNGGGHLSEATALVGLFIERGPVVQLRNSRGQREVLDGQIDEPVYDGPLGVLVDRFSASASEIFAAAIQDYGRGPVIGQRTFGKGSVQNLYSLDRFMPGNNLGQLTLTIGKYYRITGGSTQHRGVEPDIELPSAVDITLVGESARDSALPWDQIDSTRYQPADTLSSTKLALLSHYHRERTAEDADFRFLLEEVAARQEQLDRGTISLNLETRREQNERIEQLRLQRENARRDAQGLPQLATLEELAEAEQPDVQLQEATRIVADLARLQGLAAEEIERAATSIR